MKNRIGEINYNTFGSEMIITKYRKYSDVDIYFPEYNWTFKNARYDSFKKGNMRCPYEPRVFNKGYLGEGEYKVRENNKNGEFNNSFHVTRDGIKPKTLEKIILQWSSLLNKFNVQFINVDYTKIHPSENDLLYLDPPYANTKGMYYGKIDYNKMWDWLRLQKCDYMLSFDGKTSSVDMTYEVPADIYTTHEYLYSGNSSFRRVIGTSNSEYVKESLYISY